MSTHIHVRMGERSMERCYRSRNVRHEETAMDHGFALFAATNPEIIRAVARDAESLGYRQLWVNHPGNVDGLAALAHAAAATKTVDLGVGVIPLTTRGPQAIVD